MNPLIRTKHPLICLAFHYYLTKPRHPTREKNRHLYDKIEKFKEDDINYFFTWDITPEGQYFWQDIHELSCRNKPARPIPLAVQLKEVNYRIIYHKILKYILTE